MAQERKLERILGECEELLQTETEALEAEDLDSLEMVLGQKDEAIAELTRLLDSNAVPVDDDSIGTRVRAILNLTQENALNLAEWMDKTDQKMALLSRGRNRLKGVRHSYVTVPREGFLDRGRRFEA